MRHGLEQAWWFPGKRVSATAQPRPQIASNDRRVERLTRHPGLARFSHRGEASAAVQGIACGGEDGKPRRKVVDASRGSHFDTHLDLRGRQAQTQGAVGEPQAVLLDESSAGDAPALQVSQSFGAGQQGLVVVADDLVKQLLLAGIQRHRLGQSAAQ